MIQFHVRIPTQVEQEDGQYISSCPPLDIYSQGRTEPEAMKNLVEAVQLFIESCYERGTLQKVLDECGFELMRDNIEDSGDNDNHNNMIDVPLSILMSRHAENHPC